MVRNALLICLLLFVSCKNERAKQNFSAPEKNDINEIIKAIISADSLSVWPNSLLSADLTKITILSKDTLRIPSPMGKGRLTIGFFTDFGSKYFSKKDSSYLVFQNHAMTTFRLDSSFSKLVKLSTNEQLKEKEKQNATFCYYALTIPIFSLDRKTAYVGLNFHCLFGRGNGTGYGMIIFLKKTDGKWKIISRKQTGVS